VVRFPGDRGGVPTRRESCEHGGGINFANGGLEVASHGEVAGLRVGVVIDGVLEGWSGGGGGWGVVKLLRSLNCPLVG
jgi:hypothetical protein